MNVQLEQEGSGEWTVRRLDARGELTAETRGALPVSEVCRRLRKSRRQVYRYLRSGMLEPVGKFLGEWLVDARGIEHAARRGIRNRPVPASALVLYPEYEAAQLRTYRDAAVIVPRLLEQGDQREIRWMLARYGRPWLGRWVTREGWRLSPRAARFWSWWLRVPAPGPRKIPA